MYRKEKQASVDPDPEEEDMEDVRLDDKIERHWMMVYKYSY